MIRFRLKELMAEKGVSYRELSREAGVSTSTLNNMVQERPRPIQTDVIDRLCGVLECHPSELIVYEPDRKE